MTDIIPRPAPVWVPDACTLPTAEQPIRVAAFDELLGTAVLAVHRPDRSQLALELDPTPAVAARVAELTALEVGCCAFFAFTLEISAGSLRLTIRTPPSHADVLDALAARATSAQGPPFQ